MRGGPCTAFNVKLVMLTYSTINNITIRHCKSSVDIKAGSDYNSVVGTGQDLFINAQNYKFSDHIYSQNQSHSYYTQ